LTELLRLIPDDAGVVMASDVPVTPGGGDPF